MEELQLEPKARDVGRQPDQFQFIQDIRKALVWRHDQQYQRRKRYELASCAFAVVGILLMLAENEHAEASDEKASTSSSTNPSAMLTLKWVTTVTTLCLDVFIILQYAAQSRILQMQNAWTTSALFSGSNLAWIMLELLVCSFHIPPGVTGYVPISQYHSTLIQEIKSCPISNVYTLVKRGNGCYLVYEYPIEALGVFMTLRLYLIGRYMRSSSSLYSQWVAFIGSLNDVNAMRPFFHFKALFKIQPLMLLVPLTLLNTFLSAAIIRILERPVEDSFENYWKAVWLTAVTISATGFGDYYPVTYLGRSFITISAMFGGVLLVALIQSLFFGVLELSPKEQKVKHLIDLNEWEKQTYRNAVVLVQTAWKSRVVRIAKGDNSLAVDRRFFAVMKRARELRATRPILRQNLDDQLAEMEDVVLSQLDHMKREKAQVLERIQSKARHLGALKKTLEERKIEKANA